MIGIRTISKPRIITTVVLFCFFSGAYSQPCVNGTRTNPYNPVNDQFVPLMNNWFPDSLYPGTGIDTENPFLNTHFNWYLGAGTIFLYPGTNSWAHQWSGNPDSVAMINPFSGSMPSQFSYLRPDSVAASNRDFRWEVDGNFYG